MSAKERQRKADYKRRLRHRLARRPEDDGYAALLQTARVQVRMETGEQPYDHDLALVAEYLARSQWPDNRLHSVHADRLGA